MTKVGRDPELEDFIKSKLLKMGMNSLASEIQVSWNPRLQTTAGLAFWHENIIQLNPKLKGFEVKRTLLHELAHLVARARSRRRKILAHGNEWKQACADLGIPGEQATHHLPWPRRKVAPRYHYRCPHCSHVYPRVKPFKGSVACKDCCKRFSGGNYDARFKLSRLAPGLHG